MQELLVTWFREWTVHPVTQPYRFRSGSVAYPFHIRSHSVDNRHRNFSYGKSRKRYGYVTVVSRSLRLHYGCAAVVDGHLRLVTEKLKFSNNLKIVSRKKRTYGSMAVYPGLSRITTVMSTANVRNCHGYLRFETVGFRHVKPWKCNKGFMMNYPRAVYWEGWQPLSHVTAEAADQKNFVDKNVFIRILLAKGL